jgi:midasin (ATPase involved in ribosome maturation)
MAILEARSPLLKDSKDLSTFVRKTLESLSNYRQRQRVFEKDGLVTIRNLLKWCERKYVDKEKFAVEGYAILAEKLRN